MTVSLTAWVECEANEPGMRSPLCHGVLELVAVVSEQHAVDLATEQGWDVEPIRCPECMAFAKSNAP